MQNVTHYIIQPASSQFHSVISYTLNCGITLQIDPFLFLGTLISPYLATVEQAPSEASSSSTRTAFCAPVTGKVVIP